MDTNGLPSSQRGDTQIASLLDRIHDSASIVDRLMAMPAAGEPGSPAPEWDAAVARRLERRLAESMRALIGGEPERRRA